MNNCEALNVHSLIEKSIEDEDIREYTITITSSSSPTDGYSSDITFANVEGVTKNGKTKILNLAIKVGKLDENMRKHECYISAYKREAFMYDKVFVVMNEFQKERKLQNFFDSVPKCYKTFDFGRNGEALVMDNLKALGYVLHDRKNGLNLCHLKKVLEEYGKYHALSFALRDQNKTAFDDIAARLSDDLKGMLAHETFGPGFDRRAEKTLNLFKEKNHLELCEKLKKLLVKSAVETCLDSMNAAEDESVIVHGDNWSNNFMYLYENGNTSSPIKVAILDWQLSTIRSPVFELSYFIYANSSKEGFDNFQELLRTYHNSFSSFLRDLGSDPDKLFPYTSLLKHWKKYSSYGILWVPLVLQATFCDKEEAPVLKIEDGKGIADLFDFDLSDNPLFFRRLRDAFEHYFSLNFDEKNK